MNIDSIIAIKLNNVKYEDFYMYSYKTSKGTLYQLYYRLSSKRSQLVTIKNLSLAFDIDMKEKMKEFNYSDFFKAFVKEEDADRFMKWLRVRLFLNRM